jgi:two-component system response regulator MprA
MTAPQRPDVVTLSSSSPASIVVVDDDPNIVEALDDLLRGEGFAVEGFIDPAEALSRLRRGPAPDLVLCDCIMPRLTGPELCEALAAAGIDAPVLLMTALADPSFCVDTARVSVLNKPFQLDDLLAEIEASLRPVSGSRTIRGARVRPAGALSSRSA